ncbi:MAG TPA: helix-turn-helix domain-containing protein [Actinocrinis sp.]|nr:helix-turn-helix domain-containing protein [Actinocrinis sp.]
MLGRTYEALDCPVARALELVGERWSLLILRDGLFSGITRFGDFQRSLGLATNILSARLDGFVASGLMERRRGAGHPEHYEYVLTDKSRSLLPAVLALAAWGQEWVAPDGLALDFEHCGCDGVAHVNTACTSCGQDLGVTDVNAHARLKA